MDRKRKWNKQFRNTAKTRDRVPMSKPSKPLNNVGVTLIAIQSFQYTHKFIMGSNSQKHRFQDIEGNIYIWSKKYSRNYVTPCLTIGKKYLIIKATPVFRTDTGLIIKNVQYREV